MESDRERTTEMGHIHEGRAMPERASAEHARLRRHGSWVEVTFRGFDGDSTVRTRGLLNLDTVRNLIWDQGQQVTVIEYVGEAPNDDERRCVERPDLVVPVD